MRNPLSPIMASPGSHSCSNIFNEWLDLRYEHLNFLVSWPEREAVKHNMPESFKRQYPNCRVIIDYRNVHRNTSHCRPAKSCVNSPRRSLIRTMKNSSTSRSDIFLLDMICSKLSCHNWLQKCSQKHQSLSNKSRMYSEYKSHMTWKVLFGISPNQPFIKNVAACWNRNIKTTSQVMC
jgi:hypothetical protein